MRFVELYLGFATASPGGKAMAENCESAASGMIESFHELGQKLNQIVQMTEEQ